MEPAAVKAKPTAAKGPPPAVRAQVPLYTTGAEVVTPVATKPKTTAQWQPTLGAGRTTPAQWLDST
eukprot:12138547-Prorocentrum_lima.AAC.1